MGNPSQSYGASLTVWDHTVLPATRHKWTRPALTPARQAGTRFTYPGMEGWVDLGRLIAAWPGIEPTTAWSQVRRRNSYATESPLLSEFFLHPTYTVMMSESLVENEQQNNFDILFAAAMFCSCKLCHYTQVLDHVMVGIEGITKERGHHLIRERCAN